MTLVFVTSPPLHPTLTAAVNALLDAMLSAGFPMRVTATTRTVEQQQALYAQGRTAPGPIVTQCDGVTRVSKHQIQADGFGHAVDCAFMNARTSDAAYAAYGALAEALGLTWGGRFVHLVDEPHVEIRG